MKSRVRSPRTNPSAKTPVTFRFNAPEAKGVAVAGTFCDWQPKKYLLTRNGAGEWTATIPLLPGHYEYRFVVDGEWCDDPDCVERVSNPFGSQNCLRNVLCEQMQALHNASECAEAL